jgi:hypothetical protein
MMSFRGEILDLREMSGGIWGLQVSLYVCYSSRPQRPDFVVLADPAWAYRHRRLLSRIDAGVGK